MTPLDFTRNQKLALCALVGMSAIGLSTIQARKVANDGPVVLREAPRGGADVVVEGADSRGGSSEVVVCHVSGCVRRPGVYTLRSGQRVMDAVRAAGGGKDDANLDALNLAARVEDGSKIEVPSTTDGALAQASAAVSGAAAGGSSRASGPDKLSTPGQGVVNINKASATELQQLPGVGPATAEKIISYRRECGGFRSPEQLIEVKGIGPKTFEKMRPFVRT